MVEIINNLQHSFPSNRQDEEIGKAIKSRVEFTKLHFSAEEALMQEIGFPEFSRHRDLHKKLIDEVVGILLKIKNGKNINVFDLYDFLADWLLNHIANEDRKIGKFILKSSRQTATESQDTSP